MHSESNRRHFLRGAGLATIAAAAVAVPLPAAAVVWPQTLSVAVRDTVRGATEDIVFSGQIIVTGNIIIDTVATNPRVLELIVDFSAVSGTGATTGKKYVTAAQSILHRPLKTQDPIQVSFPYYIDGQFFTARTALASMAVTYVAATGMTVTSKLTAPVV